MNYYLNVSLIGSSTKKRSMPGRNSTHICIFDIGHIKAANLNFNSSNSELKRAFSKFSIIEIPGKFVDHFKVSHIGFAYKISFMKTDLFRLSFETEGKREGIP